MTTLAQISETQAQKATTANENFNAVSPAGLFGRKASTTSGLTWGFFGGILYVDGVATTIADGTVALTGSTTNYIEATRAGVLSKNTTGFTAGSIPLYTAVTGSATITSYIDQRAWGTSFSQPRLTKSVAGSSNVTLTAAEARAEEMSFTGALTGNIEVIFPAVPWAKIISNDTSGAFSLTARTSDSGSPTPASVAVPQGSTVLLFSDGSNVKSAITGFAGDLSIGGDLTVTGNLTVSGTTTTINVDTMTVEDPLIKLATGNAADVIDIGFYGTYQSGSPLTAQYSGLFRDASDGKWKLFDSLQDEPTTTVNTSGTGYTAAALVVGVLEATRAVLTAGTATTAVSPLAITQTWNASGVAFPGLTLTITDTASAAGSMALQIKGGAAGATDFFAIDKSGNVGIGTGPTQKLDVAGSARFITTGNTNIELSGIGGSPSLQFTNAAGTSYIYSGIGGTNNITFSPNDVEVARITTTGVDISGYQSLIEMTAPAGVANYARLFAKDNGAGKTQLMVIFGSGTAQQIAIEA